MFEKVLVPTDFSSYSRKELESIGEIPGLKEVVLLHVVARNPLARIWDPVDKVEEAKRKLDQEMDLVKAPGVSVKSRAVSVMEGGVAGAIQKVAEEEKADLVVMGARGKSLIQSVVLGSVSRNVLRYGDKHLLIMRYKMPEEAKYYKGIEFTGHRGPRGLRESMAMPEGEVALQRYSPYTFSKVLVPTDFSQPAEAALSFVKSLKGISELVLLHVVSGGESKEDIDAAVARAKERLEGVAQTFGKEGLKVTSKVVVGDPVGEIRAVAEEVNASLIAMSSTGMGGAMRRGRIGSRTYDLANTANRPVMVVRLMPVFQV